MKLTKNILLLLFVVYSSSLFAQSQSASQLLERDIMVSAKTLSTDVMIYNYFYLEKVWAELETPQGRQNYIQRYLSARGGSFWDFGFTDNSPKNYAAGAGLYFAIDPLISKSFGNTFIEIRIPAGTKFINVVNPLPLKKDTLLALQNEGIINSGDVPALFPRQTGFYRDTLRMMVLPQFNRFRQLVHQIFSRNQIQFIEYNFNSSLTGFCRQHSYSAFNFVAQFNPTEPKNALVDYPFKNVQMYSTEFSFPNLTTQEIQNQDRILKFRSVLEEVGSRLKRGQKQAATQAYILSQYSADEYAMLKTSTFSCK